MGTKIFGIGLVYHLLDFFYVAFQAWKGHIGLETQFGGEKFVTNKV